MDNKTMLIRNTLLVGLVTGMCVLSALGCHVNRRSQAERGPSHASIEAKVEAKVAEATAKSEAKSDDKVDLPILQEVRQSYQLSPNAKVAVSGINGLLEIETAETDTAEIYLVRSVRNQEDFNERQVLIEQQGDRLLIRVRNDRDRSFWAMLGSRHDERQRAYLKLPRQVQLEVSGINGKTRIGEIGGRVELSGLNGPTTVARATGAFDLSGANGNIEVTLAQLAKGVDIRGVNGNIELRFLGEVNADLEARGVNGNINPELPNVTVREKKRGRMEARIGNGGSMIDVSGVNGSVHLLSATNSQTAKLPAGGGTAATK